MTEREEEAYIRGQRSAYLSMLRECLRELGYDDPETKRVAWVAEREEAITHLRDLCATFGDNDWPESLHLGDIIEKHLADHLFASEGGE